MYSSSSGSCACEQTRNVTCYDTTTGTAQSGDDINNCDASSKPDTSQSCENCARTAAADSMSGVIRCDVDNSVTLDILQSYNHEKCTTDDYYNLPDNSETNLLIVRKLGINYIRFFMSRFNPDSIPIQSQFNPDS